MSYQKDTGPESSPWHGKTGVFLIAEIGGNHEGNFEYAKHLTQLAIDSGVDAVKFQIYTADSLVNPIENPQRYEHFKRFVLKRTEHIALAKICIKNNVDYIASVWDIRAIDWIDDYISIYKIGSGDLTAYPIIKSILRKSKPIILSTGMSTLKEVKDAIAYIKSIDSSYISEKRLALLQCTSAYPLPQADANLKVIVTLKRQTNLPVGYSDHTTGSKALEIAVALGAEILEFHFTDTRVGKKFRDHKVSLIKDEVLRLKRSMAEIKNLLGDGIKRVMPAERDNRRTFRRAVYPAISLPKGSVLTKDKLFCLRPNHGVDARDYDKIVKKRTTKRLARHEKINKDILS
ncbi:MAG: N-acetylneuraminate synthase family protein [Candidatus Omnitrophota bacterium]